MLLSAPLPSYAIWVAAATHCSKPEREEEDVDVFNIDVPLPCGESPVHLAFLLGQKDLGHDCV